MATVSGSARLRCGSDMLASLAVAARRAPRGAPAAAKRAHVLAMASRASEPHLQLATAKIPSAVDTQEFQSGMYQWAATLTTSGQNMPFVLPMKTDKLEDGFVISMCNLQDQGGLISVGDIQGTVEEVAGVGNVFFVRFYLGDGCEADASIAAKTTSDEKLKLAVQKLVDVDTIMNTMPNAIKNTCKMAM
mmetsp:Transcript_18564/g.47564  ORF Transcript_18564/g.47564 Transcript_18564/m.47564 type:complete len:190 (+) Transcript_18564:148-717(+)|eukprot:jgi/Tetstr1/433494/TSEL_022764.t1